MWHLVKSDRSRRRIITEILITKAVMKLLLRFLWHYRCHILIVSLHLGHTLIKASTIAAESPMIWSAKLTNTSLFGSTAAGYKILIDLIFRAEKAISSLRCRPGSFVTLRIRASSALIKSVVL
jgi:hypothetical protein